VTILPDDTSGNDSAKADLNVVVINRRGGDPGLTVVWEYSADLFDPDTARALLDSYQTVLVDFVRDSAQRLTELPLLGPTQRQQLLADSGRAVSYERDTSIVDLFEARVRETPGAVAVVSHGVRAHLPGARRAGGSPRGSPCGSGAGLGAPVAMLMERSVEAVIALFAILKTGSAYVALDPSFPTTRIGWLIEDAHAVAVCTTGRYSTGSSPTTPPSSWSTRWTRARGHLPAGHHHRRHRHGVRRLYVWDLRDPEGRGGAAPSRRQAGPEHGLREPRS